MGNRPKKLLDQVRRCMPALGGPLFALLPYTAPVWATSYLPWIPFTGAPFSA